MKNCGYPFHLQISRKEFLNDLVKRFPEKPPVAYSRVQTLILQAIQEWWETICCTSKYKADLGYIRDMHRLLNRKGYIFPEVSASEAAVLNPADTLRSATELEQEERDAQEAKLQELIRRGSQADLQEANRLMKVMAGFQDQKTNYRAKVAEDVDKVRRRAELLDEMLANLAPGTDVADDDVFADIVSALKTATPKIKALIDEEHEDDEAVRKLLALNDYIVSLIEKYSFAKNKDFEKAQAVAVARPASVAAPATSSSSAAAGSNSLSLIDFGDEEEATSPSNPSVSLGGPSSGSLDLLSQFGGLNLSSTSTPTPASPSNGANLLASLSPSSQSPSQAQAPAQSSLFSSSPPATQPSSSSGPNYDILRSLSPPRSAAPSTPPTGSASLLFSTSPTPASNHSHSLSDEWKFASPAASAAPAAQTFQLLDDGTLVISGTVVRDSPTSVHAVLSFANRSATADVSQLDFLLAVKRELSIRLDTLSATALPRHGGAAGAQQHTYIGNVAAGGEVKLRWKVAYAANGAAVERDGILTLPQV